MDFNKAFKVFELNILRQAGVTVTPQQAGLKSDPIADLQAKQALPGSFNGILGKLGSVPLQGLTPPTPPVPPSDPSDSAAQSKYQQALLTYQSQFQVYNQRMTQVLFQQIQALQQSISAGQQTQGNANRSGSSSSAISSEKPIGVGGILGD